MQLTSGGDAVSVDELKCRKGFGSRVYVCVWGGGVNDTSSWPTPTIGHYYPHRRYGMLRDDRMKLISIRALRYIEPYEEVESIKPVTTENTVRPLPDLPRLSCCQPYILVLHVGGCIRLVL